MYTLPMKQNLATFICLLLTGLCYAQDFRAEFEQAFQEGDTLRQLELLTQWEQATPEDAELFVSYFNYYFFTSRKEVVMLTTEPPKGEGLMLEDSIGQTAGFLGSQFVYDPEVLAQGFTWINKGIEHYPNRLDMRFGKIYVLSEAEEWESFTHEIIETVRYSRKNNNEWTWALNEPKEAGEDFLLSSIQDYQVTLFNTEEDSLLVHMRQIAQEVLTYYPTDVPSLSNLSVTYLLTGEYEKGIEPLLQAEKIDPTDVVVLSNIAHGYKLKGDTEQAIAYYEKMAEYGDERAAAFAQQQIEALRK